MQAEKLRELSDLATLRLQNKEGTASSNRGGWLMISTILIEAWDLYSISFILVFLKKEWANDWVDAAGNHIYNFGWVKWGMVTAAIQAGAILGAILGGYFADQIGRKKMFIITMILFIVLALAQAFTPSNGNVGIWYLIIVRFLLGIPLGSDIANGYAYIMESMSKGKREMMGVRWQFMFAAGEVVSILVIIVLIASGMNYDTMWRFALALGAVPALIVLLARLKLPETPLSLVQRGRFHAAKVASKELFDDSLDMLPDADVHIPRVKVGDFLSVIWKDKTKRNTTVFGWISNAAQGFEFSAFGLYLPLIFTTVGLAGAKWAATAGNDPNGATLDATNWMTSGSYIGIIPVNFITAGIYAVAAVSGFLAPYVLRRIDHKGISTAGFGMAFIGLLIIGFTFVGEGYQRVQNADTKAFSTVFSATGTSSMSGLAVAIMILGVVILMWGHYWDASNGQTLCSLVAPPRFKATAGGFGYMFVKLASCFGALVFPLVAGLNNEKLISATFLVSIASAIALLSAIFILPKGMFGYVETETAQMHARVGALSVRV
jgi:MFS family permease